MAKRTEPIGIVGRFKDSPFKLESRLRNPWALLLQAGASLIFLANLPLAASLWLNEKSAEAAARFVGALVSIPLLAIQMHFTWKVGRWYGSMWLAACVGLLLPSLFEDFQEKQEYAQYPWMKLGFLIIVTIYSLWLAWFDFIGWPNEAKERGLALDAPRQDL